MFFTTLRACTALVVRLKLAVNALRLGTLYRIFGWDSFKRKPPLVFERTFYEPLISGKIFVIETSLQTNRSVYRTDICIDNNRRVRWEFSTVSTETRGHARVMAFDATRKRALRIFSGFLFFVRILKISST